MSDLSSLAGPAASGSEQQPKPPMIDVRGLTKRFADTFAVRNLSFQIAEGEIFGFIGPNGAGKTTTLRVLATLLEPTAGEAFIDGLSVEEDTEQVRQVIGYMPDYFGVYEGITVDEYLEFFAGAFRLRSARRAGAIRDVMELTDLGSLSGRMVASLSRGMKQRLCLAKTLLHDPKVLLLDEPASALDPRARIELRALLKELSRMGKTILISSHILTELSDLCTSVGIIEKGALIESGGLGRIGREECDSSRVKITLHAARDDIKTLLCTSHDVSRVEVSDKTVSFDYRGAPEHFYRVIKLLVGNDLPLLSIEQESKDLESLFLKVTRGDVQ